MARTVRGKRIAFDNISVGNATGAENTIAGSSGGTLERPVAGTSAIGNTSAYPENFMSPCGSSFTSPVGLEILRRTVGGGQVSDRTTDRDH